MTCMKQIISNETCPKREGKEFAAHVLQAPFVTEKSIYYEEKAWNNASYVMHRMLHSFVIRANGLASESCIR